LKIAEFVNREQYINEKLAGQPVGSGVNNLNLPMIRNLIIPLAPLPEQGRIAKILNEQMAAVEKARKEAEQQLSIIEVMPSALLRKAFRGEI